MKIEPVNKREKCSRLGWQRKNPAMIKLGELAEWRSGRTRGDDIHYVIGGQLVEHTPSGASS